MTQDNKEGETKLYAGKYKTVEELEQGYKLNSQAQTKVGELEKEIKNFTDLPSDYQIPANIALHEDDIAEIKTLAKNSGMTQKQFEKYANEVNQKSTTKFQSFEQQKKDLGADQLNLLQEYVTKNYPKSLHDTMIKSLITNKAAREEALEHRTKLLSSSLPGTSNVSTGSYRVTEQDVLKARSEMDKVRGRSLIEARNRYLGLLKQQAEQKKAG